MSRPTRASGCRGTRRTRHFSWIAMLPSGRIDALRATRNGRSSSSV
jgi:hypothetical protein